jgi:hypothetical protein
MKHRTWWAYIVNLILHLIAIPSEPWEIWNWDGIHNFRDWRLYFDASANDSTSISWESVFKISRSWLNVLIFTPFYFESFICPDAIYLWIRQRNSIKFCASFGKSATETLTMIRQAFEEKITSRTRKVWTNLDGRGETGEVHSEEHAHHFSLTLMQLFTRDSPSEAKQSIPHITVTFYGYHVKICEDVTPNFVDKWTGCCITTTHCLTP